MKKIIIGLALTATLSGCATTSSKRDFGTYPNNYESVVKDYYHATLRDPDSAKWVSIRLIGRRSIPQLFKPTVHGFLVCATLNGKNAYGAYTGYITDGLIINNGVVVRHLPNGMHYDKSVC
ncbi:lipoprotein [Thalassotalea psychrophila]|uniref:Type IV secretion system putative lipoprotein virB7 n=1 Tax=Thalassotalea psychrophila TaxID=3065647 RepID=A0ABY9TVI1_9GAMM|nr:lipoprotein [Colwelliaceae bacterium SQ149]